MVKQGSDQHDAVVLVIEFNMPGNLPRDCVFCVHTDSK